jgi:hypothetical protein
MRQRLIWVLKRIKVHFCLLCDEVACIVFSIRVPDLLVLLINEEKGFIVRVDFSFIRDF